MWFNRRKIRYLFNQYQLARFTLLFVLMTANWTAFTLSGTESLILHAQSTFDSSLDPRFVLNKYCVGCHNQNLQTAGLALDNINVRRPGNAPKTWERVIIKLRAGLMPPPGMPRPDEETYKRMTEWLETEIDEAWAANPNPGRIEGIHRLNRTEYNNAIRDLFSINFDATSLLPGDETADGSFDNFAKVLTISRIHLERYLSLARQITRLATGMPPISPTIETFTIPLHVVQDDRESENLPFGSRGGIAIPFNFPVNGEYLIKVRLRRQYQDYIMGMGWPQQLDVRLDGRLLKRFTVGGQSKGRPAAASYAGDGEPGFAGDSQWEEYMQITADAGLEIRIPIDAGPHIVGVSFVRHLWEPEGLPQPIQRGRVLTNDQIYMGYAAVDSVQIGGPYRETEWAMDTPSRRAIFVCEPGQNTEERVCATQILSRIARLAYRRPLTTHDLQSLLEFFDAGRQEGKSFDAGIQFALERILVDPDFLLRIHRDPVQVDKRKAIYHLSDIEVASRLSFFLWSSIPDEKLLALAEKRELTKPKVLEQQVLRMLDDPRATETLVNDFAAQWLNLRRVHEVVVDPNLYPNYDETLLQAFKQETELFITSTLREDRSVTDLLNANYTFVNERLARHYQISEIYGSRFRRIILPNLNQRGGLLAKGALLATTSYPDRTSPVLRGKWLLDNIFGLPIPPPPPGVDTDLEPEPGRLPTSIRERLSKHRKNPQCASCHAVIDPLGFALENFDAIGGWRTVDESGKPVDATGTMPNGEKIKGLLGLRNLLLADTEQFPRTVTEKLLAYALGRRLEYFDKPTVRAIVKKAATNNYRWSSLITEIVKSPTFLMRTYPTVKN